MCHCKMLYTSNSGSVDHINYTVSEIVKHDNLNMSCSRQVLFRRLV